MNPNGYGADIAVLYTVVIVALALGAFILLAAVLRLVARMVDYLIEKRAPGTRRAALIGLSLLVPADIIAGVIVLLAATPVIRSDWGDRTTTTLYLVTAVSLPIFVTIVSRLIRAIRDSRKIISRGNVITSQVVSLSEPSETFRDTVAEMVDRAEERRVKGQEIVLIESDGVSLSVLVVKP